MCENELAKQRRTEGKERTKEEEKIQKYFGEKSHTLGGLEPEN